MIRDFESDDRDAVRAVVTAAFGQVDEADLVERLRGDGDVLVELVAVENGAVIGHILFSRLAIERPDITLQCAALAPVAVIPDRQNAGIGGALIRAGNERGKALGLAAILVVGYPTYYPRFGFSAKAAETLEAPFHGAAFMALELLPGALAQGGRLRYAAAFGV